MDRYTLDKMEFRVVEGNVLQFRFEGGWAQLGLLAEWSQSDSAKNKRYEAAAAALRELLVLSPDLLRGLLHAQVCDYDEEIRFRCEDCQKIEKTLAVLRKETK